MRLGSAMEGLAAAKQGQEAERPRLALAKFHKVSPRCTVIVGPRLLLALRVDAEVAVATGILSWAPNRIWLGSAIVGLTDRSSGQRLPAPRFCCATFQSESPRCTRTVFLVATVVAGCAVAGRVDGLGKAGGANVGRAGGSTGWRRVLGRVRGVEILGRTGGLSRSGARSIGRTSLRKSERTLGRSFSPTGE